jgi:hypothetical protein
VPRDCVLVHDRFGHLFWHQVLAVFVLYVPRHPMEAPVALRLLASLDVDLVEVG